MGVRSHHLTGSTGSLYDDDRLAVNFADDPDRVSPRVDDSV
jgi:hypothetical protein